MEGELRNLAVDWLGPFCWPGFENRTGLLAIPNLRGVYLWTFEYEEGYLIYAAGITRRPIPKRFKEHTRNFYNGEYNVLDVAAAQHGMRTEVWPGWEYARAHRDEFEARRASILEAAEDLLAGFRIFVADVGTEPRILERIEAAIMHNLARCESPLCDIPDKGMFLAGRWPEEDPIKVKNNSLVILYGLPEVLSI